MSGQDNFNLKGGAEGARFEQQQSGEVLPTAGQTLRGITSQQLDPLGALAQLLGINSALSQNKGPAANIHNRRNFESVMSPMRAVYNKMMGIDTNWMKPLQRRSSSGPSSSSGSFAGQGGGFGPAEDEDIKPERIDPYAKVREAAIESALRYLKIQNPHSFDSLKRR